jgi:hypothetical protein
MNDYPPLPANIQDQILDEAQRDYLGLWWIARTIMEGVPGLSPAERRQRTLGFIEEMIGRGRLVAGVPSKGGHGFTKWEGTASEIASQISAAWKPGGPDPDLGDIVWLTAPEESLPV